MTRRDMTIVCKDCGRNFVFRGEEQDFFAEKGYSEPTRCKDCRIARKNSGGPANARPPRESAGGRYPEKEMYPATCSSCGKSTKVPFKPRDGKPVYCSDCFARQR